MTGVLQRFEQRLEDVVSGAFARAFRSAVQPVEIASALQREVDNSAHILSRDRMLVPNAFTVELSQPDFDRLTPFGDTLAKELAAMVGDHVKEQRYTLTGEMAIEFVQVDALTTGRFRVRSETSASVTPVEGQRMTDTAVTKAGVILEVGGMRHPLTPPGVVVGRGAEADLKINDPGVSRRHAEIKVHGADGNSSVTVVDLGSTNGVILNGRRVDTAVVADGSEIKLGNTVLRITIVRSTAAGDSERAAE